MLGLQIERSAASHFIQAQKALGPAMRMLVAHPRTLMVLLRMMMNFRTRFFSLL